MGQRAPPLPTLIALLKEGPHKPGSKKVEQEAGLLEDVAVHYSGAYDFISNGGPNATAFSDLFDVLVKQRLLDSAVRSQLAPAHLLRVLQCLRLLSRDAALRQRLISNGGMQVVASLFKAHTSEHFTGTITTFQIEVLTECASIIKRLAGDEWGLAALVQLEVHSTLVALLSSTDPAVLPLVLVALIGFAAHRAHYTHVTAPSCLDTLLRIVQSYDLPFKRLAADLLALLARRESVVAELLALNSLGRLVGQLVPGNAPGGDGPLVQSLLRVVCYLAADGAAVLEMYHVGSIPVLLALVKAVVGQMAANPHSNALPSGAITEMQLACTALTRLAEHDECSSHIRACNGVVLLGKLLLVTPARGDDPKANDKSLREVLSLKAYVFRALRYLFSVERNRKMFKRLFPPDLFASFIDIGHYNSALTAYAPLVQHFEELSEKQKAGVSAALDDVSSERDGAGLRTVGGYVILEMLGKGAFGAVYKARKSRGEGLVALKELPLSDVGIFGATDAEVSAGVGRMSKEVEILSSLSHPNIVQYYESFGSGPYLYIAMELVEGVSLLDHLQSLVEKNKRMAEADIWQVLIAVVLALNYIHSAKKVVHRDLTPGNIVLGALGQGSEGLKNTKIADFGLAKRLSSSVVAQSMVGTMPYTCPEIIQQAPYSAKADVWSLGCVAYHMMMLRPPFDGTNPLSVAHKIVEGSYDPVADPPAGSGMPPYSDQLKRLVKAMMTVDPNKRPDSGEVAALVSNQLMAALERAAVAEQKLLKQMQVERSSTRARRGSVSEVAAGSPLRAIATRKLAEAGGTPGSPNPGHTPSRLAPTTSDAVAQIMMLERIESFGMQPLPDGGVPSPGPSGGFGAGGPQRTVALATSRLRPVSDPLSQMLTQLHKVMWVEQLPPGLARDHRRRAVESFRRHLFGQGSNATTVKQQLAKLQACHADVVTDPMGRPIDFGAVPLGPGDGGEGTGGGAGGSATAGGAPGGGGTLTYAQLHSVVEGVLGEKGYYSSVATALVSEAELLEPLPGPNFNLTPARHGHSAGQLPLPPTR